MVSFTSHLKKDRYRVVDGKSTIELKLKTPNQLFDERDPSPFRERDLDDDAVRYIVSAYRELSSDREAKLSLYFASLGDFENNTDTIRRAIHAHFEYEAELKRRELRFIFKQGFISLFIGLTFLLVCTWFSHAVPTEKTTGIFHSLLGEWLLLMGWVATWKPISIFLYEWWPIQSAQNILRELSKIEVHIHPIEASTIIAESTRETRTEVPLATRLPMTS